MVTNIDAVPSSELDIVNIAGIYGFWLGLFKRGQISPMETTYKVFHRLHAGDFLISTPKAWEVAISRIKAEF
jgi:type I restriction enzyme S subunit